jgi:hypothetical protein
MLFFVNLLQNADIFQKVDEQFVVNKSRIMGDFAVRCEKGISPLMYAIICFHV